MKFVADLHLHSKYSRAVSQSMMLPNMAHWAKLKGINVVATGDLTHPFWLEQLKNELEDAGNGLYRLKSTTNNLQMTTDKNLGKSAVSGQLSDVYFLLSCEISSIYSQGGKVRRIHNLFFFPSLSSVEKFNMELLKRGANLRSDGRPIVGINSRNLAELALACDKQALIIPAHAWTPWFSVFGSFSGFDSIEECFGDMAKYVYGIETGLSSDPAMNWQIADLDRRSILSFSDAHSLEKMGREATVFEGNEVSYDCIYDAIRSSGNRVIRQSGELKPDSQRTRQLFELLESERPRSRRPEPQSRRPDNLRSKIAFTIEFYPEEGKYHFTGHRDCNYSQGPEKSGQTRTCPVCKKPLTVGVMDRVKQLASREISNFHLTNANETFPISNGVKWVYHKADMRPPFVSLVPLGEILAEAFEVGVGTKKVVDVYLALVSALGNEFSVLMRADLSQIRKLSSDRVEEAISKVRSRDIVVDPGYDGKFGVVKIWTQTAGDVAAEDAGAADAQLNLFA